MKQSDTQSNVLQASLLKLKRWLIKLIRIRLLAAKNSPVLMLAGNTQLNFDLRIVSLKHKASFDSRMSYLLWLDIVLEVSMHGI